MIFLPYLFSSGFGEGVWGGNFLDASSELMLCLRSLSLTKVKFTLNLLNGLRE